MAHHNLTNDVVTAQVQNGAAAGTTNVTGSSVDSFGFDNVRFIASIGTLTATQVTALKIQESSDNSTFTDMTGGATAAMADGDSNKLLIADVYKPAKRYLRPVLTRGTANAVLNCIIAESGLARRPPVTQDTTVSQSILVEYV